MTASRAGLKNWAQQPAAASTAYTTASCVPAGICCPASGSTSRLAISTQRIASAVIIVTRRSHRSTHTPANGPANSAGTANAISAPLTAAGAQDARSPLLVRASRVTIHNVTVTVNTMSPVSETDWPSHSHRQLAFRHSPLAAASAYRRPPLRCPLSTADPGNRPALTPAVPGRR